jgi:hypothetical protein
MSEEPIFGGEEDLDSLVEEVGEAIAAIPVPTVITPSGAEMKLLTEAEKANYEQVSKRYTSDNIFTNISDLQELDRILTMETLCYRWSQWLLEEKDYYGDPVNVADLKKNIEDYSKEVRLVKKALGIDKATREKDHGETVADYINSLRLRAKEFGIVRNEQAVKAITLWQELIGIVTFHLNCSPDERDEFKAHEKDVIAWINSKMDEFNEIDAKFRETSQKYWVREL